MDRRFCIAVALASVLVALPVRGQGTDAPFVVEESGARFDRLADAVAAIGGGSGTILIAPGIYRQCAVQEAGRIAYVARQAGTAILDGVACEGKAALVLAGRSAHVEGIVFQNIRVPDMNGAGIRLERGALTVRESLFRDGENGILVATDHRGAIRIEQSTFSGLGLCPEDHGCSHAVYNSGSGALSVHRTRFERGTGGHYLKSRAGRIEVTESSFDDSAGRATNYMIDLSYGASGTIAGNFFVQGRDKENYSAFITVAPEGREHGSRDLRIADNEAGFVPGLIRRTAFVADWSGDVSDISGNRIASGIARYERR
jgi:hypothetical protein